MNVQRKDRGPLFTTYFRFCGKTHCVCNEPFTWIYGPTIEGTSHFFQLAPLFEIWNMGPPFLHHYLRVMLPPHMPISIVACSDSPSLRVMTPKKDFGPTLHLTFSTWSGSIDHWWNDILLSLQNKLIHFERIRESGTAMWSTLHRMDRTWCTWNLTHLQRESESHSPLLHWITITKYHRKTEDKDANWIQVNPGEYPTLTPAITDAYEKWRPPPVSPP